MVQQWWNRKLYKSWECDLEKITHKDIQMLEMIRGIHSQALRKEFLKEKEPILERLLTIANKWQRSADIDKNMETNSTASTTDVTHCNCQIYHFCN